MILFKYLWKSLLEKKARTFLVLFSIAVSAALIFANEGFKGTIEYMFHEANTRNAGNSDFLIEVKKEAGAVEWVDIDLLREYRKELEYVCPIQSQQALYAPNVEDMYYFQIYGVNMKEFQEHNPFGLQQGSYEEWNGFKVIIGDIYAKRYSFSVGDTIILEMNGNKHSFTIAGIANQEGIYSRELADGGRLFMPKETLEAIYGEGSNIVYLKVKEPSKREELYERLSRTFSDYQVEYTVDSKLIDAEISNYLLPFRASSLAVIFMTMFIISTGFGMITSERISSLGTLRSLGVTRKRVKRILILESAGIGAIGGLIGCVFGIGVLVLIKDLFFQDDGSFANSAPLQFGMKEIITTTLAAILITGACAILSINKVAKLQIKEIILYQRNQKLTKKSKLWMVGFVFILTALVLPPYLPTSIFGMVVGCILATGVLAGLVLIIPGFIGMLAEAFNKLGLPQEIYLGIRNVSEDKALLGNLKLFSAMIAIVVYMASIFHTMSYDLHYTWDHQHLYDVSFILREADEESLKRVKEVDGVTEAVGYYENYNCKLGEDELFLNMLYGIEDDSFFEMNVVGGLDEIKPALLELNQGKHIIITNILKMKLGVQLGDTLKIRYGEKVENYKITGFVDTNLGIGHVAYISGDNFKSFIGAAYYDTFKVDGNVDPDTLKLNLKREFTKDILSINTKQEQERANADKVDSMFNAISIYTYFAVGVGMLGMFNNIMSGFLERKRSFALYRCIGMSNKGISKMLISESITIGLSGSLFGLTASLIMTATIPQIVGVMWGKVATQPAYTVMAVLSITGFITMLMVSILPLTKSRKISIMESMRYE